MMSKKQRAGRRGKSPRQSPAGQVLVQHPNIMSEHLSGKMAHECRRVKADWENSVYTGLRTGI